MVFASLRQRALVHWIALVVAALPQLAHAQSTSPVNQEERSAKLRNTPVTVYPNFDVSGTAIIGLLNRLGRQGDVLAVSYLEALQPGFTVDQLGLESVEPRLLLRDRIPRESSYRNQLAGMRGVVVLPSGGGEPWSLSPHRDTPLMGEIRTALGGVDRTDWSFTAGLPEGNLRRVEPHEDLARRWPNVAFYWPRLIQRDSAAYRHEFERIVGAVLRRYPSTGIELILPTASNREASLQLVAVALANIDLATRIGIVCDDSAASQESLVTILEQLRQ